MIEGIKGKNSYFVPTGNPFVDGGGHLLLHSFFAGNSGKKENKTVIKRWKGRFKVKGHPEFLAFAYDAGLGSRNSQGFGMVNVVYNRRI